MGSPSGRIILLEASFASSMLFLPPYVAELGANPAQVGLIIGAWGGLRLVFLGPSGILVYRFPAVPLIVVSRAFGVAGLLIAAALPVWWLLPIPLALTGVANIAFPAIASIAAAADEQSRARARARRSTRPRRPTGRRWSFARCARSAWGS